MDIVDGMVICQFQEMRKCNFTSQKKYVQVFSGGWRYEHVLVEKTQLVCRVSLKDHSCGGSSAFLRGSCRTKGMMHGDVPCLLDASCLWMILCINKYIYSYIYTYICIYIYISLHAQWSKLGQIFHTRVLSSIH